MKIFWFMVASLLATHVMEAHDKYPLECSLCCSRDSGPFIVLAVEARGLDYTSCSLMIQTLAKHPKDGTKNSDVGHAWIYMQRDDEVIQGGHSAETGEFQPRYIEGVYELVEAKDPNPVSYLFEEQRDGFFEKGCGFHKPTFAAKIPITSEQFDEIKAFLKNYPWSKYNLSTRSCASLLSEIGALLGFELEHQTSLKIDPVLDLGLDTFSFWKDERYSVLVISNPDTLELELIDLVKSGRAQNATKWLARKQAKSFFERLSQTFEDLRKLPERTLRWLVIFAAKQSQRLLPLNEDHCLHR